jgi:hypothetical protein
VEAVCCFFRKWSDSESQQAFLAESGCLIWWIQHNCVECHNLRRASRIVSLR